MSLLQNSIELLYVILILINNCSFSFSVPTGVGGVLKNNGSVIMLFEFEPIEMNVHKDDRNTVKGRVKRQTGAGKFADAAKMPSTKLMRLVLQMFTNLVSNNPVGGNHPMSPDTVKPVVKLFKHRIVAFFFPDVGEP